MQQYINRLYLEKTMVIIMLGVALSVAFFKPAVSIGLVGLLILSLLRFFIFNKNEVKEKFQQIDRALIFFYLFFVLWLGFSVFWSEDTAESLKRFRRFSHLLVVPIIIGVNADLIGKNWRRLVKAAVVSCSAAAIPTFWFFIFPDLVPLGDGYTFIFKELSEARDYVKFGAYSPFLDRLYFGYLTGFCLLGLLALWIRDKKPGTIHWSFLILIPLLVILGARGAQLAFGVATVSGLFYFLPGKSGDENKSEKGSIINYLVLGSSLMVIVMMLALIVKSPRYAQIRWEWSEYRQNPTDHEAMSEHTVILRWMSWRHNFKLIQERPVTGFGLGDYVSSMEKSYAKSGLELPVHTNQQFLFFGVVGGLPALISFTLFFLLSGWFAWKRMKSKPSQTAVLSIWMYMLIVMLFDSPMNYHMPSFLFLSVWLGFVFVTNYE